MTTTVMATAATTDPIRTAGRLSNVRAALVVAVLACAVTAGCTTVDEGGAADAVPATPTTAVSSSSTTSPATTAPTTTSTTVPIDAGLLLQSALDAYSAGYAFTASATVAGQEAATISGFVIGSGSSLTVTSGDGVADYVTNPEGAWIRVDGGDWQELEASGPFEPPLAGLSSPSSIAVAGARGGEVDVVAVYPGAVYGLETDVEMRMRFVDGILVEAGYTAGDAGVTTAFAPLTDQVLEVPGTET